MFNGTQEFFSFFLRNGTKELFVDFYILKNIVSLKKFIVSFKREELRIIRDDCMRNNRSTEGLSRQAFLKMIITQIFNNACVNTVSFHTGPTCFSHPEPKHK